MVYHIMGKQTKYNKKMKGQSMDICYYFSYGTKNKQVFIKEGVPKVYTLPIYILFFFKQQFLQNTVSHNITVGCPLVQFRLIHNI